MRTFFSSFFVRAIAVAVRIRIGFLGNIVVFLLNIFGLEVVGWHVGGPVFSWGHASLCGLSVRISDSSSNSLSLLSSGLGLNWLFNISNFSIDLSVFVSFESFVGGRFSSSLLLCDDLSGLSISLLLLDGITNSLLFSSLSLLLG